MRSLQLSLTVVWFLGCLSVISLLGIILLGAMGREPPSSLISIASVTAGALGSFLVSPTVPARVNDPGKVLPSPNSVTLEDH